MKLIRYILTKDFYVHFSNERKYKASELFVKKLQTYWIDKFNDIEYRK